MMWSCDLRLKGHLILNDILINTTRVSIHLSCLDALQWYRYAVGLQVPQDAGGHVYSSMTVRKFTEKRKHP